LQWQQEGKPQGASRQGAAADFGDKISKRGAVQRGPARWNL
jgi:hypothetical protein